MTVPTPVKPASKPKPAAKVSKIKFSRSQLDPADQSELELLEVVPSGSDSETESKTAPASKAKKRRPAVNTSCKPPSSEDAETLESDAEPRPKEALNGTG